MNLKSETAATAFATAMLTACASGGGGDGIKVERKPIERPSDTAELRCFPFLPFICGWFEPWETETDNAGFMFSLSSPQRPSAFASWSSLAPEQAAEFDAITTTSMPTPVRQELLSTGPRYTAGKELVGGALGRIADGIDVSANGIGDATQVRLIANPYALGWDYQSFGIWNTHGTSAREIASFSFGAPTPASAVPSSGSASFIGKLGATYVSPSGEGSVASADLRVNADFGNRSLGFASSGTRLTRDLKSSIAAPQLNLSGTLTYSPGANTFNGSLTNSGGTMSGSSTGRYYGPAAQELGGVFSVKSPATPETLTGAYGAKR